MVDDADVQKFVDVLLRGKPFSRSPDPDLAYRLALGAEQSHQRTKGYAEEFARKVRQRVLWVKPSN